MLVRRRLKRFFLFHIENNLNYPFMKKDFKMVHKGTKEFDELCLILG